MAFDHSQWEYQARQLAYSAQHLLDDHVDMMKVKAWEGIALLPTSQFLSSLAIELISKAYFLKRRIGNREEIYKHQVLDLCDGITFSIEQEELMALAESNVVWAGRYPTPKWTKEKLKAEYGVPCEVIDGAEHIDASKIKNSSSPQRVADLLALYSFIWGKWNDVT